MSGFELIVIGGCTFIIAVTDAPGQATFPIVITYAIACVDVPVFVSVCVIAKPDPFDSPPIAGEPTAVHANVAPAKLLVKLIPVVSPLHNKSEMGVAVMVPCGLT